MKKFFAGFFFLTAFFCAAEGIAEKAAAGNEKAETSYAFGMAVAADLADTGLEINRDAFIRGFREILEQKETRYTLDEAYNMVDAAFAALQARADEKMKAEGEKNRAAGEAFLAENGKRSGVVTTSSGLQYEVVAEGTGAAPDIADTVRVHYRGTTIDGTEFDSSYSRGEPAEFPLDRVIPGWAEGVRMMKEGGKAKLYLPSNLAYGERSAGDRIAPNSVLVFEVEFLSIVKPAETEPEED